MVEIARGINVDPEICHGKPVVTGTRVPIPTVLGQLAAGETVEGVADGYGLTREQVLDCLAFAKDRV